MDTVNIDAVTAAQGSDVFDVMSFVEGTAYPTEEVVAFTDAKAAADYLKLNKKRQEADVKNTKSDEAVIDTTPMDDEIAKLAEKLQASAIIFKVRGLPPGVLDDINTKWFPNGEHDDTPDRETLADERDAELISFSVVEVANSKGVVDKNPFTPESVKKLKRFLKEGEFNKLVSAVVGVNFNARLFDQLTDAGFPGRSSDVA